MTEEVIQETVSQEGEFTEIHQINPQPTPIAFRYIVSSVEAKLDKVKFTIISGSATDAKEGLKRSLPADTSILFDGQSPFIMQF